MEEGTCFYQIEVGILTCIPGFQGMTEEKVSLPGDDSERVPPDPIPNSEVKPFSADDSLDLSMRK